MTTACVKLHKTTFLAYVDIRVHSVFNSFYNSSARLYETNICIVVSQNCIERAFGVNEQKQYHQMEVTQDNVPWNYFMWPQNKSVVGYTINMVVNCGYRTIRLIFVSVKKNCMLKMLKPSPPSQLPDKLYPDVSYLNRGILRITTMHKPPFLY